MSETASRRPATFDHLKKKDKLRQVVSIPLDGDAVEAFDQATSNLERARLLGESDSLEALQELVDRAKEAVEDTSVRMVFQSIGRKAYDALLMAHPPTEEQVAEFQDENRQKDGSPGKGKPPYNIETFAPALIAASCVDPELTPEQVEELWDEWNSTELAELWMAALAVNTQRRVVHLGNG